MEPVFKLGLMLSTDRCDGGRNAQRLVLGPGRLPAGHEHGIHPDRARKEHFGAIVAVADFQNLPMDPQPKFLGGTWTLDG